jgi:hypothetical protein
MLNLYRFNSQKGNKHSHPCPPLSYFPVYAVHTVVPIVACRRLLLGVQFLRSPRYTISLTLSRPLSMIRRKSYPRSPSICVQYGFDMLVLGHVKGVFKGRGRTPASTRVRSRTRIPDKGSFLFSGAEGPDVKFCVRVRKHWKRDLLVACRRSWREDFCILQNGSWQAREQ